MRNPDRLHTSFIGSVQWGWFMGGVVAGIVLALGLGASPIYLSKPVFDPGICAKKRVDACGCHHVYGIRHCHPNRKSNHCEAPVKATVDLTVKNNVCSM